MNDPYHIAILDDNEDILAMTTTMLQLESYRVSPCTDTESFMSTLKNDAPDVIFLDMLLSGQDGRDICTALKNRASTAHIPVIIFSAHPNAEEKCLAAGADFFLAKPFEMDSLYEVTKKAVELNSKVE